MRARNVLSVMFKVRPDTPGPAVLTLLGRWAKVGQHTCVAGQGLQHLQVGLQLWGGLAVCCMQLVQLLLGGGLLQLLGIYPEQVPQILQQRASL